MTANGRRDLIRRLRVKHSGYRSAQNSMLNTDHLVIQIRLQCVCEATNFDETLIQQKDWGRVGLPSFRKVIILLQ